jgi:hypothetical protein
MSIRYINNFDAAIYKFSNPLQKPIKAELIGLRPAYDLPTTFHSSAFLGLDQHTWGVMQFGSFTLAPIAPVAVSVQSSGYAVIDGHVVLSNGTTVTIDDSSIPTAANEGPVQSKTVYLIPSEGPLMAYGNSFSATLDFDMPTATGGAGANDVWAVALHFKTGTVNDAPNDQTLGVTCQFSGGGNIRFHGTDFDKTHLDPGTYAGFATYPATQFSMRIEVDVFEGSVVSGTGALEFGDIAHAGTLLNGNAVLSAGNSFDASKIKAVGAAIVTTSNDFNSFGARLRCFTLSVS